MFVALLHPAETGASRQVNVSMRGAHRFDEIIGAALLACTGVDSCTPGLVADMVRIPVRDGGLGFRALPEIAPEAYAASKDPSGNDQTTRTSLIDKQHMLRVELSCSTRSDFS